MHAVPHGASRGWWSTGVASRSGWNRHVLAESEASGRCAERPASPGRTSKRAAGRPPREQRRVARRARTRSRGSSRRGTRGREAGGRGSNSGDSRSAGRPGGREDEQARSRAATTRAAPCGAACSHPRARCLTLAVARRASTRERGSRSRVLASEATTRSLRAAARTATAAHYGDATDERRGRWHGACSS